MSAHFALGYVMEMWSGIPLAGYSANQAEIHYRKRLLMAWVYRWALHWFSGPLEKLAALRTHTTVPPEDVVALFVTFVGVMLIILSARLFLKRVLGADSPLVWLSLLTIYIANYHHPLAWEVRFTLPYDMPAAAFFGLASYAAFIRNRWLYYPLFILGTFNKETTLFLPLVFLIFASREDLPWREAFRRLWPWTYVEVFLQIVLWKGIGSLCESLTGGPEHGGTMVMRNIYMLANPLHWTTYASVFGFLWIPILIFHRRIIDVRIRRCLILAPLWGLVMLMYGDPLELRIHSEWICYVAVCTALIIASIAKEKAGLDSGTEEIAASVTA